MGFFARLGNMINGFLSLFVGKIEEQNPAAVFEAAIQDHKKKYQELKKAVSNIVFLRNKSQSELDALKTELEQVSVDLQGAVVTNQDELALILLEKQDQLNEAISSKEIELQSIAQQADSSMEQLRDFEARIQELKRQKDIKLAQLENAKARDTINEAMNGLSMDASTAALADVIESIDKRVTQADVSAELAENSLDKQIAQAREAGKKQQNKARLEAMKQAQLGGGAEQSELQDRLAALKAAQQGGSATSSSSSGNDTSGGKTI
jgi:phage shock protein A